MSTADLTTTARIRDAAIDVFGENGFQVGVRAIATAAGVSPGLVNHHFGSKEGLRAACDERVLEIIRVEKSKAIDAPGPTGMINALAEIEVYAPVVAYMLRSFQAGGALAESLLEHMIDDAEKYTQHAVATGRIKPSRDPAARARYLVLCNVGAMNLYIQMRQQREGKLNYRKVIRDLAEETTFPALELYTQGMLTDPTMLDAFLEERKWPTEPPNR
ncbi:TetR/AcrR family transcriptional regulator [Nocardia bovistercoris]|uniref:TetR family transcriptional regulator n=1 Tax=Nocardia bovistercoris TaxID=2785916 RepID=A0A931IAM4_9NOCA|nr:TetR family transcriptional regulator [Nocardia bovistercoris]MBH0776395.1 TetR family transcriptional regulator [Nocardia bovistercoris]